MTIKIEQVTVNETTMRFSFRKLNVDGSVVDEIYTSCPYDRNQDIFEQAEMHAKSLKEC